MKKIALVELQEHQEVLFGLMDLLLLQAVELHVFAPQAMHLEWNERAPDQIKWHHKNNHEYIPTFIRKHQQQLNATDLIIFTTLISHFAFFSRQKFLPPTLLLIHKGNAFFAVQANLQIQSFKDGLRYLRRLWRREDFYQRKLLAQMTACSFTDDQIWEYMQAFMPADCSVLPALPLSYFECSVPVQNSPLRVVIPGTVSTFTRNYTLLFDALCRVDAQLTEPIKLIFLGKASGKKAKVFFEGVKNKTFQNIDIQIYTESIPLQAYQNALQQADFLILPLREQIRFGIIREYYGKTSISGGLNDMLRYGKPTLLPRFYPLTSPLDALTRRFETATELTDLLLAWVNEKEHQTIEKQAKDDLQVFAKIQQSERLMQILRSILEAV